MMRSNLLPAVATANFTNWSALRACETGKFVISRSCCSAFDTSIRKATPRMSLLVSGWLEPCAFEKRTITA